MKVCFWQWRERERRETEVPHEASVFLTVSFAQLAVEELCMDISFAVALE